MFKFRDVKKGTADVSVIIRIIDSTDGTPETGVVAATAGLDLKYRREGATAVDLTESDLAAIDSAHSDGGMKHIGGGYYRVDVPDAAFATGVNGVFVFGTVTGMIVIGCYVPLVDHDPYDAVRLGLTALPNAAAEAAGGLYTRGSGAGQIGQSTNGRVNVDVQSMAAAAVAAIWDALVAGITTANSIGKRIIDFLTGDVYGRLGAPAGASIAADLVTIAAYIDTEVAAIKAKTDNLPASFPANFSAMVIDADGRVSVNVKLTKNKALSNFMFAMLDSTTLDRKTGVTVTATRSIDGAAPAACANAVSEIGSTGIYKINLDASDVNGDVITLLFTGTGCKDTVITLVTNT